MLIRNHQLEVALTFTDITANWQCLRNMQEFGFLFVCNKDGLNVIYHL